MPSDLISISNHEGSVTHLTDSNGNVIEKYRYDAFGAPTISVSSGGVSSAYYNRFMFTGREYVPQFGIYEYRNRAYHPGLGRFMSEDPKGFDAGDYNLFRYCGNDPEDRTDPMGLQDTSQPQGYLGHLNRRLKFLERLKATKELFGCGAISIGQINYQISKGYEQSSSREGLLKVMAERVHNRMEQERDNPRVSEVSTYMSQKDNNSQDYLGHPLTIQNTRRDTLAGSDLFNKNWGERDPSPKGYHVIAGIVAQRVYRDHMSRRDQKAFRDLGYDGYTVVPGDSNHRQPFYINSYHYPDEPH